MRLRHARPATQPNGPRRTVALAHAHQNGAFLTRRFDRGHQHRRIIASEEPYARFVRKALPRALDRTEARIRERRVRHAKRMGSAIGAGVGPGRPPQQRVAETDAALAEAGLSDRALAVRSAQRYNAARLGRYALFPGAMDLLRRLKAHRVRLGIITNGFSETHREKIAVLQIADLFDAVFMPDEVGMVKPDPLLFSHACARLCSAPARSAMVGDRYDRDIAGALSAGLYTVWVNVRDEELPPGAMPPDATVRTIDAAGAYLLNA